MVLAGSLAAHAQTDTSGNDLERMLNDGKKPSNEYVMATFKATRIINSPSVENLAMGLLDFRISHRFGRLNEGATNFFGLDDATTRLGLDYGITNWLMVGIGHTTLNKENDGSLKVKILRQKSSGMPITLSYYGDLGIQGTKAPILPAGDKYYFSNRLYFTNQLLIARKFNNWLSLQLMPTVVHYNLVDSAKYNNDVYAIGIGGRVKVSKRIAITGEYYYQLQGINAKASDGTNLYYNSFSIGVDIETGGHVFQLMLTNSPGMTERSYIGQTTDSWKRGDLHFGFNISRVFTVIRPKEFEGSRNKIW